jgi:hypothetical protein
MTEYTYDEELFSDLYKEVNGFRPRQHEFYDASPARKQEIWVSLCEDSDAEVDYQLARQKEAIADFDALVEKTRQMGAVTSKNAVKWLVDAEGEDFWDYGMMEYQFGIPYGTIERIVA